VKQWKREGQGKKKDMGVRSCKMKGSETVEKRRTRKQEKYMW
jgi:hypothetical protein